MYRTYVRRRILLGTVLVGVMVGVAVPAMGATSGAPAPAEHTIVVEPGDTLWGIATASSPEQDPRRVVDAIVEANALSGAQLVPGQSLVVPDLG